MDALGIANLATNLSNNATQQSVGIAVFKKALDAQSSSAAALIQALPAPTSAPSLPANLGNTINTTA